MTHTPPKDALSVSRRNYHLGLPEDYYVYRHRLAHALGATSPRLVPAVADEFIDRTLALPHKSESL